MSVVFRPRLIPTLATAIIAPIFAVLGMWQTDRAAQKTAIQQLYESRLEAPPITIGAAIENAPLMQYRQVHARGVWDSEHEFYLDNRIHSGQAGLHVITPLRFAGARTAVLVNRGWIPAPADRSIEPRAQLAAGTAQISGVAVIPPPDPFVLKAAEPLTEDWEKVWQTLDLDRFESAVDYRLQGFVVRLDATHADGFGPAWSPPSDDWIYRHKAYAFQWYALCAALLVIYFAFTFRPRIARD